MVCVRTKIIIRPAFRNITIFLLTVRLFRGVIYDIASCIYILIALTVFSVRYHKLPSSVLIDVGSTISRVTV